MITPMSSIAWSCQSSKKMGFATSFAQLSSYARIKRSVKLQQEGKAYDDIDDLLEDVKTWIATRICASSTAESAYFQANGKLSLTWMVNKLQIKNKNFASNFCTKYVYIIIMFSS